MIHSLHIKNFKGIRRADVGFEPLTVIVGANASGKTSILEAMYLSSRAGSEDPNRLLRGQIDPLHVYRRGAVSEDLELSMLGDHEEIRLLLTPPSNFPLDLLHPFPSSDVWKNSVKVRSRNSNTENWTPIDSDTRTIRDFWPAEVIRFEASRMIEASFNTGNRIRYDGRGLASVLAFMALNQQDNFQSLLRRFKSVVPTIEKIRFDQVPLRETDLGPRQKNLFDDYSEEIFLYSIVLDFKNARELPIHLASEGTILVLGLLTVLMNSDRSNLVLLDDFDRGLHPKAQREVIGMLRIIMEQDPELQIIATTHSPYLVDHLRPEEVRLTTLGDDGTVSVAGLTDHPDFDKWKDEMAPGEMWSLFGEDWVSKLPKNAGVE